MLVASPGEDGGTSAEAPQDSSVPTPERRAAPVATFLDSLGVCIHIGQGVDEPVASADALRYVGIRNFRDDNRTNGAARWLELHERSGARATLITRDIGKGLEEARKLQREGALLAVEGPTEPNNFPVSYNGRSSDFRTTFLPVAELQRDLYAAVKADEVLSSIPVFHSSEAGGAQPDNVGLQYLTIPDGANTLMPDGTRYADFANIHNFVGRHDSVLVDNGAWSAADPTLRGPWNGLHSEYGRTWKGGFDGYDDARLRTLPRVTTQTTWPTLGPNGALTAQQLAAVPLDVYLSQFAQGFRYTFWYMLRDDPAQGRGLFDVDYEPKLSAVYLHNFTSILEDRGWRAPESLAYRVATDSNLVHDLLLQKSSGSFALIVWAERFRGGEDRAVVVFAEPERYVRIYDPTVGTDPVAVYRDDTQVTLTLTDHPLILELAR